MLSLLNPNDDQNLMYPDHFLGSTDYLVPTYFSRLPSQHIYDVVSAPYQHLHSRCQLRKINYQLLTTLVHPAFLVFK